MPNLTIYQKNTKKNIKNQKNLKKSLPEGCNAEPYNLSKKH